jgi:hypothetical protein
MAPALTPGPQRAGLRVDGRHVAGEQTRSATLPTVSELRSLSRKLAYAEPMV